jgi:hypothetical protein
MTASSLIRGGARREEPEILSVAIHQIDETRMIDDVFCGAFDRDLGLTARYKRAASRNLRNIACQAEQARVKERHVVAQAYRGRDRQ